MAAEDDEIVDFSFDDVVAQLDDSEENSEKVDSKVTDEPENEEKKIEDVTAKSVEVESSVEKNDEIFVESDPVIEKSEEDSKVLDFQESQIVDENPENEIKENSDNLEENDYSESVSIFNVENNDEIHFEDVAEQVESLIQDEESEETPSEVEESEVKLSDLELLEKKKNLIEVMQKENELLDEILKTQTDLHNLVKEKNWDGLNEKLEGLQILSDNFAELDEEREKLCELIDIRTDEDVSPVLLQVRGKLQKSKIENHVLNEYISTTRKFLQGVFDSVVPQRRNVLYSKNGKIVRPELSGVAVNISL